MATCNGGEKTSEEKLRMKRKRQERETERKKESKFSSSSFNLFEFSGKEDADGGEKEMWKKNKTKFL